MDRPPSITRFVPTPEQYAWTFGGCDPVMRIRPGDVLDLYTEDAFAGKIRSSSDLPSSSITYPFMVAGSYRPLDDAFRIAHTQLIRWIAAETGLSIMDTYQLVTQASRSPIANVCDANYTVVAKMPKRYLPQGTAWMGGTHDRLRATGRLTSRPT